MGPTQASLTEPGTRSLPTSLPTTVPTVHQLKLSLRPKLPSAKNTQHHRDQHHRDHPSPTETVPPRPRWTNQTMKSTMTTPKKKNTTTVTTAQTLNTSPIQASLTEPGTRSLPTSFRNTALMVHQLKLSLRPKLPTALKSQHHRDHLCPTESEHLLRQ